MTEHDDIDPEVEDLAAPAAEAAPASADDIPDDLPDAEEPPPAKSGKGFLFKAIVVVAVLAGGVVYFLLSGSAPPQPPPAQQAQTTAPPPPLAEVPAAPAAPLPIAVAAAASADPVSDAPDEGDALSAPPSPVNIVTDVPPPIPSPSAPVVTNAMPPAIPSAAGGKEASPDKEDPLAWETATPSSPASAPIGIPPGKNIVADDKTETSPTPQQQKAVFPPADGAETENGDPMPAAAVPAVEKTETGLSAAESDAVAQERAAAQEKIDALEKQISGLQEKITQLEQAAEKSSEQKDDEEAVAEKEEAVKKPAAETSARSRTVRHKTPRAATSASSSWVLKAAKPGTAWVAKKGSSALRTVTVGDTLEGLGRITAIIKDSTGHWTVSGTKGRISQ